MIWVRVQNNENLVMRVDEVIQQYNGNHYVTKGINYNNITMTLGTYSTQEKIDKVFSMIFSAIANEETLFKMPLDKEV